MVTAVGFAAAFVGVVTGGNSLVTVPVMLSVGMAPRAAVATNMLACTVLALSGGARFAVEKRGRGMRWDLALPLCAVTLPTSWLGAHLVARLDERAVRVIVAVSLVAMVAVLIARPRFGAEPARAVSRARFVAGVALAAALGVYGGLFSGGYTTLLTFTCVGLLGASLVESVGLTKVVNFVSSGIATIEFARVGLIDWRVGVPMSIAMGVGAWVGAHLAVRLGYGWVRAVFVGSLVLLAAKLVLYDLLVRRAIG